MVMTEAARWAAGRKDALYRPAQLDQLGYVPCCTDTEIERGGGQSLMMLVLHVDTTRLGSEVEPGPPARILGPIERSAVVGIVPARPRTPADHTLYGVLTRLHIGDRSDPGVAQQLDDVFGRLSPDVKKWVRREARGYADQEVDELVHEVLLEAWCKIDLYVPHRRYRSFVRRIAMNKCANFRRKRRDALSEDGIVDHTSPDPDPLTLLEADERDRLLECAAQAALTPMERDIVQLRYVLDYPLEDVARLLPPRHDERVPTTANEVRVALQRIGRRLKAEIARRLGRD